MFLFSYIEAVKGELKLNSFSVCQIWLCAVIVAVRAVRILRKTPMVVKGSQVVI